jgi:hypothetical protein
MMFFLEEGQPAVLLLVWILHAPLECVPPQQSPEREWKVESILAATLACSLWDWKGGDLLRTFENGPSVPHHFLCFHLDDNKTELNHTCPTECCWKHFMGTSYSKPKVKSPSQSTSILS